MMTDSSYRTAATVGSALGPLPDWDSFGTLSSFESDDDVHGAGTLFRHSVSARVRKESFVPVSGLESVDVSAPASGGDVPVAVPAPASAVDSPNIVAMQTTVAAAAADNAAGASPGTPPGAALGAAPMDATAAGRPVSLSATSAPPQAATPASIAPASARPPATSYALAPVPAPVPAPATLHVDVPTPAPAVPEPVPAPAPVPAPLVEPVVDSPPPRVPHRGHGTASALSVWHPGGVIAPVAPNESSDDAMGGAAQATEGMYEQMLVLRRVNAELILERGRLAAELSAQVRGSAGPRQQPPTSTQASRVVGTGFQDAQDLPHSDGTEHAGTVATAEANVGGASHDRLSTVEWSTDGHGTTGGGMTAGEGMHRGVVAVIQPDVPRPAQSFQVPAEPRQRSGGHHSTLDDSGSQLHTALPMLRRCVVAAAEEVRSALARQVRTLHAKPTALHRRGGQDNHGEVGLSPAPAPTFPTLGLSIGPNGELVATRGRAPSRDGIASQPPRVADGEVMPSRLHDVTNAPPAAQRHHEGAPQAFVAQVKELVDAVRELCAFCDQAALARAEQCVVWRRGADQ